MLCFVKINSVLFNLLYFWIFFQNASSHSCFRLFCYATHFHKDAMPEPKAEKKGITKTVPRKPCSSFQSDTPADLQTKSFKNDFQNGNFALVSASQNVEIDEKIKHTLACSLGQRSVHYSSQFNHRQWQQRTREAYFTMRRKTTWCFNMDVFVRKNQQQQKSNDWY